MWLDFKERFHLRVRGLFRAAAVSVATVQRHVQMWERGSHLSAVNGTACVHLDGSLRDDVFFKGWRTLSFGLILAPSWCTLFYVPVDGNELDPVLLHCFCNPPDGDYCPMEHQHERNPFQRNFTELILHNRKIKAKRHKTTCNIYGIAGEKTCYL